MQTQFTRYRPSFTFPDTQTRPLLDGRHASRLAAWLVASGEERLLPCRQTPRSYPQVLAI
jgi:hypothetical protein